MPEPSLLETLRQEHHKREFTTYYPVGVANVMRGEKTERCSCTEPWPCPVARYIERAEALAKNFAHVLGVYHFQHANYSIPPENCATTACREWAAALAAYREGR